MTFPSLCDRWRLRTALLLLACAAPALQAARIKDITLVEGTPIDYLDFASPESGLGSKIGLDATNKWPPETKREWGRKIRMSEDVVEAVTKKWASLGLPGSGKPIWR